MELCLHPGIIMPSMFQMPNCALTSTNSYQHVSFNERVSCFQLRSLLLSYCLVCKLWSTAREKSRLKIKPVVKKRLILTHSCPLSVTQLHKQLQWCKWRNDTGAVANVAVQKNVSINAWIYFVIMSWVQVLVSLLSLSEIILMRAMNCQLILMKHQLWNLKMLKFILHIASSLITLAEAASYCDPLTILHFHSKHLEIKCS